MAVTSSVLLFEAAAAGRRARAVLIVDDDPDILESLQMAFEVEFPDVRVFARSNGPEALVLLEHESVDLVITDYKMPEMNGVDLLVQAARVQPDATRALLSAFPEALVRDRIPPEAELAFSMSKPVDPDALIARARRILDPSS